MWFMFGCDSGEAWEIVFDFMSELVRLEKRQNLGLSQYKYVIFTSIGIPMWKIIRIHYTLMW